MANTVTTPNMNLVLPVVGSDPGPDWATNLYNSLTLVDQHNHSLGNGVQINVNGLNLTSDLTINSNNFIAARSLRFTPNSTPINLASDLGALYESGVDLWYNDGSGNQVRLTAGGVVNATSSGISNGTASASFVSSVLVVNSNSTTPANIQGASLLLGNNVANSHFLTLQPPSAMAANFSLTLPNIPSVLSIMQLDTSGNMVASLVVDNSSIQITSSTLSVKPQGIAQNMLAARTSGSTVVAGGVAISSGSGTYTTTSASFTPVTNLSVTITTTGRPVQLRMQDDTAAISSGPGVYVNGPLNSIGTVAFFNSTTQLSASIIQILPTAALGGLQIGLPNSSYSFVDLSVNGSAGTYTYTVQALLNNGNALTVTGAKLVAFEL